MTGNHLNLVEILQEFIAITCVGGSTLRNQEPGVVRAVQRQLQRIELQKVPRDCAASYGRWLDLITVKILRQLNTKVPPWGTVRKAVNVFMRACICDYYLRSEYGLARIEPFAEIPLDRITATALKREAGRGQLPCWPGLKRLDRAAHGKFQAFAARYAERLGLPFRVYLDNHLWLRNR